MAGDEREPTPDELEAKLDELVRIGHSQVEFTRWLGEKVDDIHRRIVQSPNPILPRDDRQEERR